MAKRPTPRKSAARTATRRTAAPARTKKAAVKTRAAAKPKTVKPKRTATKKAAAAKRSSTTAPLFARVAGAERRDIGHVQLEVGRAGAARVKRMIYPPGFHWAADMKPITGTELCMHAHVGFLAHGEIHIEYADGCVVEFRAPQVVAIEPGHDGWVVGKEPVVLIEFDFERDTAAKLGMTTPHRHG